MKYEFIKENRSSFLVEKACNSLKVSRSGYYAWKWRGKSQRALRNEELLLEIRIIFEKKRKTYGSPRITAELRKKGFKCSENRVARLMNKHGLKAKMKKRFKVTTHSKHDKPIAPDLVRQNFTASWLNRLWTSDITYIWTVEGWLYLAVILDVFSRKIVGWALEKYLKADIIKKALLKAIAQRAPKPGLIFHSDCGVQYASELVRSVLNQNGIRQSMSERGNCYNNAITETFFHTLKTELIYHTRYDTRDEARLSIFDYIEVFYNRERIHSSLGYDSPEEFERRWLKKVA